MSSDIQVDRDHYDWREYNVKGRWISYWHQIDEVLKLQPRKCLEIGVGGGVVRDALRNSGVDVTAMDIDDGLGVDRVGDVRSIPAEDGEFDVVSCCQVLEHIPWAEVPGAVRELRRVARGAVVSLPQSGRAVASRVEITGLGEFAFATRLAARHPHAWDGQHYWQVGAPGSRNKDVLRVLADAGFELGETYTVPEFTFHRFYVLPR